MSGNSRVRVVAAVLLAAGWVASAQEPKTTGEKIKEKVGGAVSSLKRGALSAEEAIKEQYARAKSAVVSMGIESRVYARLHWDKALSGSKVDLSSPREGVIVLSGTVGDAKARAKAVELTTDTVGVTEVIDRLNVQTTATPAATEPVK